MSIANKAGWPDTFTVASSVLGLRSGLNASALKRARNKLATDGFIEWKSRGGNLAAQYKINSLVVQNYSKIAPQFEPQSEPINKHKQKQNKEVPKGTKKFVPPSMIEVADYCVERHNGINAQSFVDYYTANGWTQGKGKPIKDWKACVRTWENRKNEKSQKERKTGFSNFTERKYDYDDLERQLLNTEPGGG